MAKVLIVDDLAVNRELLVAILGHTGHQLLVASDGAEALAAARRERPDLVITDVLMPTMDGYEFVRQLRADSRLADVPVIFCTAYYREAEAHRLAESCGVSSVLVKPCEPQEVLDAVNRAIGTTGADGRRPLAVDFDREHLALVTNKLSVAAEELRTANRRLESVVEIGAQLATERNPVVLLDQYCAAARSLLHARYAVAAVWDDNLSDGFHLSTDGMPESTAAALRTEFRRHPPFADRTSGSFRTRDPSGDAVPCAFPPSHPPVGAILAAPIASPTRRYGWLYLAGAAIDDGFTDDDERLIEILSGLVGRVYENGMLLLEAQRHTSALSEEVSERRRAEEALRTADEHMLFALAAGDVGIWEFDIPIGSFTWSDTFERIHGCTRGGLQSTSEAWYRCVHPEDRDRLKEALERLIRLRGDDSEVEYRGVWSDHSEHHIIMKGRVFRDPSGQPTVVGGVAIDATERRQLQAQLQQSQKMEAIGMLAGGVAHDFNNLLTAILGYVELLEAEFPPDSRGMRDVQQIRKSSMRAAHLTRQLLAFSRRQVLRPVLVDLNALVKDLASMLRRLIGEDVPLTLALDQHLLRVTADPGQIEQVVMNLAVNARDAMPRGGRLTIATANVEVDDAFFRRLGATDHDGTRLMVKISVTDTGTGMDEATRKRIFEPFFTTKPRGKGTGLGLATVYGIVKQSGGFVDVESTPGHGTTFDVLLPRAEPAAVSAPESRVEAPEPARGTETILLVEDDEDVRDLVRTLLETQGYRVLDFADGETALAFASADGATFDLLLCDVILPGVSGPELFERLRLANPALCVLYVSGYTDERIVARGMLTVDVPYLEKPFTGAGLTRKVREVLDAGSGPRP